MPTPPPADETLRQQHYLEQAKAYVSAWEEQLGAKPRACVTTFGCQMNARDSEKLSGVLAAAGFLLCDDEEADFVIYNTCTVRDHAARRILSRLAQLGHLKKSRPDKIVALCGCLMQEEATVAMIREKYPFVDLVFGTHNLYRFAELLTAVLENKAPLIEIWPDNERIFEDIPSLRKHPFKSGINIMYGCDNFCSYCIVPYVRGREKSRAPEDIIAEIRALVADGVVEVMLLGQNVNSYKSSLTAPVNTPTLPNTPPTQQPPLTDTVNTSTQYTTAQHNTILRHDTTTPITFPALLYHIAAIPGLERIRFMTSHPKDLSDDLITVMKEAKNICRHLHLPLQSGSSRILTAMNRHYTKEEYLALVAKLRDAIPDIAITTDIIVGFPGETEADFAETLSVVREAAFDNAFTFIYSPRSGTPAAALPDRIGAEVAKERFAALTATVKDISHARAARLVGAALPALVEEPNSRDGTLLNGRLENNMLVHFPGPIDLIGHIVDVRIVESRGFYYLGCRESNVWVRLPTP